VSEPGCGPGPVGIVGIIADLGLAVQRVRKSSQCQINVHTFSALLNPWRQQTEKLKIETEIAKREKEKKKPAQKAG
jgi:hypothetical protein